MKRLVILGAPGAGKGTQAKNICQLLQIPTFSTGAMFRSHIQNQTELGKLAQAKIEKGELVPDEITNPMVQETLGQDQYAGGFLMDGYPRSVAQAQYLEGVLDGLQIKLDGVLNIDVNLEDVVARMLKRAQIEHRPDDTEPVIRHRLEVYQLETKPLVDYYQRSGLLLSVDGNGSIEQVWQRLQAVLTPKD